MATVAPLPDVDHVADSPFDPSIPVIRPGSPEFVALGRALNKKA